MSALTDVMKDSSLAADFRSATSCDCFSADSNSSSNRTALSVCDGRPRHIWWKRLVPCRRNEGLTRCSSVQVATINRRHMLDMFTADESTDCMLFDSYNSSMLSTRRSLTFGDGWLDPLVRRQKFITWLSIYPGLS